MSKGRLLFFFAIVVTIGSVYFGRPFLSEKERFVTEGNYYPTMEDAVFENYEETDTLTVFQTGEKSGNVHYILYTINEDQLISELLYKSEAGFQRIKDSRLIIGGTPLKEAEQKLRTFIVTDGPWFDKKKETNFTYVTFGVIQTPKQVANVEIRYEGKFKEVSIENNTFLNIESSTYEWEALQPIIFYNENNEEIGGYLQDLTFANAYCH